jgi:transcriptional regulator with XRE-family HTH domain
MEYGSKYKKAFQEAMKSPEYWFEDVQCSFLDSLLDIMSSKGISQKELAKRLGKSEPYVSKVCNANALNFTLKTMVNLSFALGMKLSVKLEKQETPSAKDWD